jgi:O-methyltransferase
LSPIGAIYAHLASRSGVEMSRLSLEHAGDLRRHLAYERLYLPREASVIVQDRASLYQHVADLLGRDEPITYLEFGVGQGPSFGMVMREFQHPDTLFVGFDSFIGLPEDWLMHQRGAFSNGGNAPPVEDNRVRFVKGWFQNTVQDSLVWLRDRLKGRVLVHFDCDLYYSSLFVLSSLWPHCPEYHFIMDDFMHDDIVALHDFSLTYPVEIEFLASVAGDLPGPTLGKMTRIKFSP